MDTQLLNWKVVANEVSDVIEFGIRKRWFFRILEEKGVIQDSILKPNWVFVPIEADSTTIPQEALERLEAVKAEFPVKQVIVGHEIVEVPVRETEISVPQKVEPKREIILPDIPWKGIATVAVTLVVGVAFIVVSGMLMAFSAIPDPCLIVVLDDPDETWISICEWLE